MVECNDISKTMDQFYPLAVSAWYQHNSIAAHLRNHTIYALKLDIGLRWQEERLIRVGVASLIHDLGMFRVSQELRHKEGNLSVREVAEVGNNPVHGYNIIVQTFEKSLGWHAEVIHQEHERENGRSYPQRLTGNDISDYAKVLGLAGIYEALTYYRPRREKMLPYKAVQELIQTQKTSFHNKTLKCNNRRIICLFIEQPRTPKLQRHRPCGTNRTRATDPAPNSNDFRRSGNRNHRRVAH